MYCFAYYTNIRNLIKLFHNIKFRIIERKYKTGVNKNHSD